MVSTTVQGRTRVEYKIEQEMLAPQSKIIVQRTSDMDQPIEVCKIELDDLEV